MNNDKLRLEIANRFKRMDETLSRFNKMSKYMMYGCSVMALLQAARLADTGLNMANGLFLVGFSSLAMVGSIAQKSISMGRKNLELINVLRQQDKQIPSAVYVNSDTRHKVGKIMEWTIGLGAVAWILGKLPTSNFNFLIGTVACACMSYEYHLTQKNRKILSAEFP